MAYEQLAQEANIWPWLDNNSMSDCFVDEQRTADYLDAMADYFHEEEEALHETDPEDWIGFVPAEEDYRGATASFLYGGEDISVEEKYACDHYNEPYAL